MELARAGMFVSVLLTFVGTIGGTIYLDINNVISTPEPGRREGKVGGISTVIHYHTGNVTILHTEFQISEQGPRAKSDGDSSDDDLVQLFRCVGQNSNKVASHCASCDVVADGFGLFSISFWIDFGP